MRRLQELEEENQRREEEIMAKRRSQQQHRVNVEQMSQEERDRLMEEKMEQIYAQKMK